MKITTCVSYPDDELEQYRPQTANADWQLVAAGYWGDDAFHNGFISYSVASCGDGLWVLDSETRNACLDDVTQADVDAGRLNDDQAQALWRTSLEEAQASRYRRICAVCLEAVKYRF